VVVAAGREPDSLRTVREERVLAVPTGSNGFALVLAQPLDQVRHTLGKLGVVLALVGGSGVVLAGLAGATVAGAGLRPVQRLTAATERVASTGDLRPIPVTGHDELARLTRSFNQMLGAVAAAQEQQRRLVADAGHELRTPLAHLRMELELALRQATTEDELRVAVRGASLEAERLSQLAEGLLLIARGDRGALPLRLEQLDAGGLLSTVATRFEWRASEFGKEVQVVGRPETRVRGDRLRLEQALGNLVDNALRHGGGSVELEASSRNGLVELHVRDDGPGFPAGFVERAFERFSQPDPGRSGGGSGLGLAIVRTIAEAHGGSVHAGNGTSAGADVWLSLPPAR
jgi:signal transduction histidine kinase